ncbi:MAG: aminoglycoside phosphotransferase family protein [Gemmataceae bacterium]|nr:aminoglycoside phosphotransferase family protein [Gemmataceae bacterium]
MLSRADLALIERERPSLPGLEYVLNPNRFVELLATDRPDLAGSHATIQYVRYKPQMSCLVGYELRHADRRMLVSAKAIRPADSGKADKAQSKADNSGRSWLGDLSVSIQHAPSDDVLTVLPRLWNAETRPALLRRCAAGSAVLWTAHLDHIRWKPERRYVGRLSVAGDSQAVIKVHSALGFANASVASRAFSTTESVRCPRRVGRSRRHAITISEWLNGSLLHDLIADGKCDSDTLRRTGAALRDMQVRGNPVGLRVRTCRDEAHTVARAADWVGWVIPGLAAEARRLATRLAGALADRDGPIEPTHGDFYTKQVVVDVTSIGIIDFDEAGLGDPAGDAGTFVAHLERDALRDSRIDAEAAWQEFLAGYAGDHHAIMLHAAAALVRLAPHPFRSRESDWPERTAALLSRAGEFFHQYERLRPRTAVAS